MSAALAVLVAVHTATGAASVSPAAIEAARPAIKPAPPAIEAAPPVIKTAPPAIEAAPATEAIAPPPIAAAPATAAIAPAAIEPQKFSALLAVFELRPAPRIGAAYEHKISENLRLAETLTFGLGSFPDFDLRVALEPEAIAPFAPWIAFRLRRIDLSGLPPVENYLSIGIAASTDASAMFSAAAGFGLRFQLPPLANEPARDRGAYLAENVAAEVHFALRFRVL